jgi:hypothetical protein
MRCQIVIAGHDAQGAARPVPAIRPGSSHHAMQTEQPTTADANQPNETVAHFAPHDAEDVIRCILRVELDGESLKSRDIRAREPVLFKVALRHFRTWSEALRAAGIDPEAVANRRKWTVDRILRTIHDLHRRGVALNYASAIAADYGAVQMAAKLLGSWDQALRTAGFDPGRIRRARRPWTREEIIDLIRVRAAAGLPITSYRVCPKSVEVASRRVFGSWKAALSAAGVANPSAEYPVWTKITVVEGILRRQQAGEPLNCYDAAHQASRLYDAARRHFGSWRHALREAGIDPEIVRCRRRPYTKYDIVAHLQKRSKHGDDCRHQRNHPESIVKAARRLFGSWSAAIAAAALPDDAM